MGAEGLAVAESLVPLYQNFISEIFCRIEAGEESLSEILTFPNHINNWKNCNFCWLQIRMICEYIALGIVLVHHEHLPEDANTFSKWKPKDLLKEVGKLSGHPNPIPVRVNHDTKNIETLARPVKITDISRIYGQTGDLLHAGSLNDILGNNIPSYDVRLLRAWLKGFRSLLMNHVILLPNLNKAILCQQNQNGKTVQCELHADGDAVFITETLPDFNFGDQ